MNIVIIGLGGIGSILVNSISRFLNYSTDSNNKILLVDGDRYEPKNHERQEFLSLGKKAEVKADELEFKFDNIEYNVVTDYIDEENVSMVINNGDVVFICVDNHKSRKIINNYCKTLTNVTVISGGNELTDGNAQLYVREGGVDITPDLCAYHPEIANPTDLLPTEMSCEELSKSEPQLYFANMGAAYNMCLLFYNSVMNNRHDRSEVYYDIVIMASDSKTRTLK